MKIIKLFSCDLSIFLYIGYKSMKNWLKNIFELYVNYIAGGKSIFSMKNSRQNSKDSYFMIIQSSTNLGTAVNGFHKYD